MGIKLFLTGIACLAASAGCVCGYYSKPGKLNGKEIDLLKTTSRYINYYEGNNPKQVLKYAQQTLNLVEPNHKISNLEENLERLEGVSDKKVYDPILDKASNELYEKVKEDERESAWWILGLPLGLLSLTILTNGKTYGRIINNDRQDKHS